LSCVEICVLRTRWLHRNFFTGGQGLSILTVRGNPVFGIGGSRNLSGIDKAPGYLYTEGS
jgi:hypothetical protein